MAAPSSATLAVPSAQIVEVSPTASPSAPAPVSLPSSPAQPGGPTSVESGNNVAADTEDPSAGSSYFSRTQEHSQTQAEPYATYSAGVAGAYAQPVHPGYGNPSGLGGTSGTGASATISTSGYADYIAAGTAGYAASPVYASVHGHIAHPHAYPHYHAQMSPHYAHPAQHPYAYQMYGHGHPTPPTLKATASSSSSSSGITSAGPHGPSPPATAVPPQSAFHYAYGQGYAGHYGYSAHPHTGAARPPVAGALPPVGGAYSAAPGSASGIGIIANVRAAREAAAAVAAAGAAASRTGSKKGGAGGRSGSSTSSNGGAVEAEESADPLDDEADLSAPAEPAEATHAGSAHPWTEEEDAALREVMHGTLGRSWPEISKRAFPDGTHTKDECIERWKLLSKPKGHKGPWTPEEDAHLFELTEEFGPEKWVIIASKMVTRTGKQCRERWHNHLDPNSRPYFHDTDIRK